MASSPPVRARACIEEMNGYVAGEQPGPEVLKLNTNENPYPPAPEVLSAIAAALGPDLRRYPDARANPLRDRIARHHGVDPDRILVGNGSDELLALLVRTFVEPGQPVVIPWPTYSLYPVLVSACGGELVRVPCGRGLDLPIEDLACAESRLTFVANPNSPSGRWCAPVTLCALAERIEGLLVLDEAYADFAGASAIAEADPRANVVVVRTFSKSYSLAGLRVGYLVADPRVVEALEKVQDSYSCDSLSIVGANAAIEADSVMRERVQRIVTERERLSAGLVLLGFEVVPSSANFLFCRTGGRERALRIFEMLRVRGILVRYFGDEPALDDGWRITVGTTEEVDRLLSELGRIVEEESG